MEWLTQVEGALRSFPRLKTQLHANGTNIEGEWEDVMAAVKFCHERLHSAGQFEVVVFVQTLSFGQMIPRVGNNLTRNMDE